MANKLSLIAVFLGVVLMLQGVQGWWDIGHMVVSQIALIHLNANSASSPQALLALNNAISALVTYSNASDNFVTAACWMDDLKTRDLNQFNNWHFINLPICNFPNSTDTDSCNNISVSGILADSKSGDVEDALWAINQAVITLKSKSALGFERGFALRNLLHIVGDIHQPLHAVNRFAPETPNGDYGGNSFLITGIPFTTKLHGFWDSGVGYLANTPVRPLNQNDTDFIFNTASSIVAKTASLTANVTTINVTDWAVQSRLLAISYAYNLTYQSTPSDYYISQAWEVIQNQLGWAGYRLYLLLKDIAPCSNNGNCAAVCTGGCGPNQSCTGPEVCTCNAGYDNTNTTGLTCTPVCTAGCGPNESCTGPEACTCNTGYDNTNTTGLTCTPVCSGGCGPNESCTGPEVCTCNTGYDNTNTTLCTPVCSAGCGPNESCTGPEVCTCNSGYNNTNTTGLTCTPVCSGGCGSSASCLAPETCVCSDSEATYVKGKCEKLVDTSKLVTIDWKYAGIALAAALGVSLLLNIVLCIRSRRSQYNALP